MTSREEVSEGTLGSNRWVRLGWSFSFVLAIAILLASLPGYYETVGEGLYAGQFQVADTPWRIALNVLYALSSISAASLSLVLAWILYHKRSSENMVVFLSFFLLLFGVGVLGPLDTLARMWAEIPSSEFPFIASLLFAPPFIALMLLFPDGRFVPGWSRWLVVLSIPIIFIGYAVESLVETYYASPLGWIGPTWTLFVSLGALIAQIYRYRLVSGSVERQQTKWVVYGLFLMFSLMGMFAVPHQMMLSLPPGSPFPWWGGIPEVMYTISLSLFPLSLTIAVLRYRLYDIDIIINRTLVYGALTAVVVGFYVLLVGVVSLGIQSDGRMVGALLTAVLFTVIFKPLRAALQRSADRLTFGGSAGARQPVRLEPSDEAQAEQFDAAHTPLSGRWLRVIRLLWVILAALALGIFIASIPGYFYGLSRGGFLEGVLQLSQSNLTFPLSLAFLVTSILAASISLALAWLLYRKKPGERMAIFLSFFLLYYAVDTAGPIHQLAWRWPELYSNIYPFIGSLFFPLLISIVLLFPDGRFVPSWTRWLVVVSIPIIPISIAFSGFNASFFEGPLIWIGIVVALLVTIGAFYAQIYRYRVVSGPVERQQTKWVVYGFTLMFLFYAITAWPYAQMLQLPPGSPQPWWVPVISILYSLSLILLPLSLSVAVLRYRLYDIDIIINRTIVYGVLTAGTMGIYVFSVGYLGNLLQTQDKSIIAFLTTGLVALLFQPIRQRLQGTVNRLMYGERDDPVAILTSLGNRLETAIVTEAILPGLVEAVAQALKLPYVAVEIENKDSDRVIAAYGQPQEEVERYPLIYQAETIGQLVVACRSPGESFSQSESVLLRNIARQAGATVQAIQLTTDLRLSRQRLVTTREEERRRLRRDLHDGLGPVLASQGLKIAAVSQLLDTDPQKARRMLDDLLAQNEATVAEIRRLVYDLRPAALDELGLVSAVRDYASGFKGSADGSNRMQVNVSEPKEGLPTLPAAIEVSAYRIATEALTNVSRHSRAKHCKVIFNLEKDNGRQTLHLEIADDGVGMPQNRPPSVGLTSMRERAEEVGGSFHIESIPQKGTRVLARLPLWE